MIWYFTFQENVKTVTKLEIHHLQLKQHSWHNLNKYSKLTDKAWNLILLHILLVTLINNSVVGLFYQEILKIHEIKTNQNSSIECV